MSVEDLQAAYDEACETIQAQERLIMELREQLWKDQQRIDELTVLLRLAYPWLMDMQAAAEMTDNQHGTDESGDALDRIRGICQQVQAAIE